MISSRYVPFTLIALIGLVADQVSKSMIDRSLKLYQSLPVIDGLFSITYVRNRGAAFSFLSNASWRIPFFIAVSLIAALVILVALRRLRDDQKLARFSLALIFSGAVGNLIDRVRLGEVIDFLDVYWRSYHWPAFNIADSLICTGVALMAFDMLREEKRTGADSVTRS